MMNTVKISSKHSHIHSNIVYFMDVSSNFILRKMLEFYLSIELFNLNFVPKKIGMSERSRELSLWTKHYSSFMSAVTSFTTSNKSQCWMPLDNLVKLMDTRGLVVLRKLYFVKIKANLNVHGRSCTLYMSRGHGWMSLWQDNSGIQVKE